MRTLTLPLALALALASSACDPPETFDPDPAAPYRMGLNMIRTTEGKSDQFDTPEEVVDDLVELGAGGIRHLRDRDLSWFSLYDGSGSYSSAASYDFSGPDAMFFDGYRVYVVPTLFQLGSPTAGRWFGVECPDGSIPASASEYCKQPYTPDGDVLDVSDDDVEDAVRGYVRAVASRYAPFGFRHFEVLNELARYRHTDYGLWYDFKYEPEKYVDLLEVVRDELRDVDPDIRIVDAGMYYTDQFGKDDRQELWEDWFDRTLENGAGSLIDVVNLHYYGDWQGLRDHIDEVRDLMAEHGIEDKPIWLTEMGLSATAHDEETQAKTLVKLFAVAFCNGVELAGWHTHISSNDSTTDWGGYGLRKSTGPRYASWYAYRLLAGKIGNFGTCDALSQGTDGIWAYRFSGSLSAGAPSVPDTYVLFTDGSTESFDIAAREPDWSRVRVTETLPDSAGEMPTHSQEASKKISVTTMPKIVEEDSR